MPQAAKDVTAFGSGTNLTTATGILAGFLRLNRRFRAAGFLVSSLGSGLLLCQSLKGFFARRRPTVVPHLAHFDPRRLSGTLSSYLRVRWCDNEWTRSSEIVAHLQMMNRANWR
jgi:hypothetical protein